MASFWTQIKLMLVCIYLYKYAAKLNVVMDVY